MSEVSRQVYPRDIRQLHWLIVGLVILQWITSSWMEEFFGRAQHQPLGTWPDNLGAALHMLFGATILGVMLLRGVLRFSLGTPPPPSTLLRPLQLLALVNHMAFYIVLILLPLTGVASLFFARDFASVHVLLKNALIGLALLHVAGVLVHIILLRDGVIWRMLGPPKSAYEGSHHRERQGLADR